MAMHAKNRNALVGTHRAVRSIYSRGVILFRAVRRVVPKMRAEPAAGAVRHSPFRREITDYNVDLDIGKDLVMRVLLFTLCVSCAVLAGATGRVAADDRQTTDEAIATFAAPPVAEETTYFSD